ncbi:MAG: hypothetical protein SOW50_01635 [Lachnospiraceae bacterium]|nr:hypothetical protein [Lachnospiraceae bacterium]
MEKGEQLSGRRSRNAICNMYRKYQDVILVLGINLVILLIFWGGLLHNQYNADTIYYLFQSPKDAYMFRLEEGRFVLAFLYWFLPSIGINVASRISVTTFFNLLMFAIAITINYFALVEDKKLDYLKLLCVDLVCINVFFAELLMFAETLFGVAYIFAALAVWCYWKKKHIGFVLSVLLAVSTYQYTAIYIAIILLFVVGFRFAFKICKESVRESFLITVFCLLAGVLNVVCIRLLGRVGILPADEVQKESEMGGDLAEKIASSFLDTVDILRDCKELLMGQWIFLLVSALIGFCIIGLCMQCRDWNRLGYFILLFVVTLGLRLVIPCTRVEFDNPPRFAFSYFLVQGLFLLTVLYLLNHYENKLSPVKIEWGKRLVKGVVILYVMVQLLSVQNIVINKYASKAIDETFVRLMYQRVQEYETETGITVTKFASVNDVSIREAYEEVGATAYSVNERVLGKATWSIVQAVTEREFERVPMDQEVYEKYFAGKNWDYLNLDEQLVILDDTAYWCIY